MSTHPIFDSYPKLQEYLEQYAQATIEIAKNYLIVGKWDVAFRLLEAALEAELDDIQKARLWCVLGNLHERRSDYGKAESVLNQAREIAEREQDEGLLADVLYVVGELPYFRCFIHQAGDHHEALEFHEKALAIREKIGDQEGQCFSLSRLGTIHERVSDMETALDYFQRSVELGESIGFEPGIWRPLVHIGFNHIQQGDHEEGLALQTRARDITQRYQIKDGLVYTLVNVAYAQFLIDRDVAKAIEACQEGLAIGEEINFPGGVARDLYMIGMIAMEGEDVETAIDYFTRTSEYSTQFGFNRFSEPAEKYLKELKEKVSR